MPVPVADISTLPNSYQNVGKVCVFVVTFGFLLMVLLWDMREQQIMSEIIHDDHTGHWAQMNETALSNWLTPMDRCLLRVNETGVDLVAYRKEKCAKKRGISEKISFDLYCNVGSSIGKKVCIPPLTTRSFFTAHLKDKVLGDPHSNVLRDSMRKLALREQPIVFIGDGLSKQNQDALICELMRTDRVSVSGKFIENEANFTIKWRNSALSLNVLYYKLTRVQDESEALKRRAKYRNLDTNYEHGEQRIDYGEPINEEKSSRSLRSKQSNGNSSSKKKPGGNSYKNKNSRIRTTEKLSAATTPLGNASVVAPVYTGAINGNEKHKREELWLNPSNTSNSSYSSSNSTGSITKISFVDIQRKVQKLVDLHKGVVLVVNVGVFYNSRERFRNELPLLLGWMNNLSKERNSTVFFRETAAQHWNHTESGYYNEGYEERRDNNGTCVPIKDSTPEFDWRNKDIHSIIENNGYGHIHVMPFRDITLPLFNMHPSLGSHENADCTHFCYFPQMWQSIWYNIYQGVHTDHDEG